MKLELLKAKTKTTSLKDKFKNEIDSLSSTDFRKEVWIEVELIPETKKATELDTENPFAN